MTDIFPTAGKTAAELWREIDGFAKPICPVPVVDGDENADIYGHASTAEEALALARECFVDEVVRVERYGHIRLSDGSEIPEAFVAITNGGE